MRINLTGDGIYIETDGRTFTGSRSRWPGPPQPGSKGYLKTVKDKYDINPAGAYSGEYLIYEDDTAELLWHGSGLPVISVEYGSLR